MRFESGPARATQWTLVLLLVGGAARAADPPPAPARPATAPKALNLRIGNVRNYMMPNEFQCRADRARSRPNTVIVEGERELLPLKSLQPVPNRDHRAVLGARASAAGVEGFLAGSQSSAARKT